VNDHQGRVNIPILIASLLLSLMLWAVVFAQNTPADQQRIDVRLEPGALDPNRYAVVGELPKSIAVLVTGSKQRIQELRESREVATLDLSASREGRNPYPVALPARVRDAAADPDPQILVELEPVRRLAFNARVETTGQLRDRNYLLDELLREPKQVTLSGASTLISAVTDVRATLQLGTVDPEQGDPINVRVWAYDRDGRRLEDLRIEPPYVQVTPILRAAPQEKPVFVLARITGKPAPGYVSAAYAVEPDQVVVSGEALILAGFSKVETEPIDITGLTADRPFLVSLKVPRGLKVRPRQVRVRVIIKPSGGANP